MNDVLIKFLQLLEDEENALRKVDLPLLESIKGQKVYYLNSIESLMKNKTLLESVDKELLIKIQKKNKRLQLLYQFSLSLFTKNEPSYGKNNYNLSDFNIKV